MFEKLSHITPDSMPDEASREIVGLLLNAIEDQQIQIEGFKEEVQKLRDENIQIERGAGQAGFFRKKSRQRHIIPQRAGHKKQGGAKREEGESGDRQTSEKPD